jgi:hypothetical protein
VGDRDGARRHLAAGERSAALWRGSAWQGALLEARAHLARAEGDGAGARRLWEEAAECFASAGQPLDERRCRAGASALTGQEPALLPTA